MKILQISDVHSDVTAYRWLREQAASGQFDLIAIAGDLLDFLLPSNTWRRQMEGVEEHLVEIDKLTPVALCSGNHDEWIRRGWAATISVTYPDRGSDVLTVRSEKVRLVRLPWEASTELSQLSPTSRDTLDIWLHHEPSDLSRTGWDGAGYCGSLALRSHIRRVKPSYVLSGHIHWAPFAGGSWAEQMHDTIVFNAGMGAGSSTPSHIIIDTDENTARWLPGDMCEGTPVNAMPAVFDLGNRSSCKGVVSDS